MAKRRTLTMTVTVTVPAWMTQAQARREVRTIINHQCNWLSHGPNFEEVIVRARKVVSGGGRA